MANPIPILFKECGGAFQERGCSTRLQTRRDFVQSEPQIDLRDCGSTLPQFEQVASLRPRFATPTMRPHRVTLLIVRVDP